MSRHTVLAIAALSLFAACSDYSPTGLQPPDGRHMNGSASEQASRAAASKAVENRAVANRAVANRAVANRAVANRVVAAPTFAPCCGHPLLRQPLQAKSRAS